MGSDSALLHRARQSLADGPPRDCAGAGLARNLTVHAGRRQPKTGERDTDEHDQ